MAERKRASLGGDDSEVGADMGAYLARRKEGLEDWESREGELLEKLKHTVTKQNQLGKQLQAKTRGKSVLMEQTDFDKIDLLNVNIDDIVDNKRIKNPTIHRRGWAD